ncbi:hypothetical protein HMPREF5505_0852, partial [Lactobacillus delbrueckii subsp. lactis DSM 20072]
SKSPTARIRKKVAIGKTVVSLTGAYAGPDMVCLFADASGVYWFKGKNSAAWPRQPGNS